MCISIRFQTVPLDINEQKVTCALQAEGLRDSAPVLIEWYEVNSSILVVPTWVLVLVPQKLCKKHVSKEIVKFSSLAEELRACMLFMQ
jgi:hypothetical protein